MSTIEKSGTKSKDTSIAGLFYPKDTEQLKCILGSLFKDARDEQKEKTTSIYKAMVIPHAGYKYSGLTAAHGYKYFNPARFKKVLILGPSHRNPFEGLAVYPEESFTTPLGTSPRAEITQKSGIVFSKEPFAGEHSVEVHLPFIQYRLQESGINLEDYPVTLMVYGSINTSKLAKKLENFIDEDTFVVLSSDLSHFHEIDEATTKDEEAINAILSHNPDLVEKAEACGRHGIAAFLQTKQSRALEPEFIHYSNSANTTKDNSKSTRSVVGYCSIGYRSSKSQGREENVMQLQVSSNKSQTLTEACKKELLKACRFCIESYIKNKTIPDFRQLVQKYPFLLEDGASFVTLNVNGNLRGCIGSLMPNKPLIQDLMTNAVKAAFEDPRFKPLSGYELQDIKLEISILNPPRFVRCKSEFDLLNKIEPHTHGLIVQQGNKRATFLPQVWEKINKKTDFLTQLCKKAGLKPDAWRIPKEKVQIFVYTVTSFEEE